MPDRYNDGTEVRRGLYDTLMGFGLESRGNMTTQEVFQTTMAKRERCRDRIKTHGKITYNDLVILNACDDQRELFAAQFNMSTNVPINLENLRLAKAIGLDINWLVSELIPDRYYSEYSQEIIALGNEYYDDRCRLLRNHKKGARELIDLKAAYNEKQVQLVYRYLQEVVLPLAVTSE